MLNNHSKGKNGLKSSQLSNTFSGHSLNICIMWQFFRIWLSSDYINIHSIRKLDRNENYVDRMELKKRKSDKSLINLMSKSNKKKLFPFIWAIRTTFSTWPLDTWNIYIFLSQHLTTFSRRRKIEKNSSVWWK